MVGKQIRQARLDAALGQIALARQAGIVRSMLQRAEEGGNITVATLESLVVNLPTLKRLTLGGVEFVAVSRMTADEVLSAVAELRRSAGTNGAARFDHDGVDEVTRQRIAALDDAVDRGELTPDSKHRDS